MSNPLPSVRCATASNISGSSRAIGESGSIASMSKKSFNLAGLQATTHPVSPLVVVHGPIAKQLGINEIGVCNVALDRAVAFDAYTANRDTGGFILINRMTNNTVGAGMLNFALRRAPFRLALRLDAAAHVDGTVEKACGQVFEHKRTLRALDEHAVIHGLIGGALLHWCGR